MAKPEEKPVERTYTIPLRQKFAKTPRYKRGKKAGRVIKEFLAKHMKVPDRDLRKIKLDPWLNQAIWLRGIKKPPYKVTVKVTKTKDGIVKAELVGLPPKYKVETELLLKKKAKIEARTFETKKKRAEEARKIAEEEKRKADEAKKAEAAKTEGEKSEEKREEEKKVEEKIMLKEMAKMETKPQADTSHLKASSGKREKKEMRRMALEK